MFILAIAASTLGYVIYAACEDIAQYMVFKDAKALVCNLATR